jgi:catechol 2,3-dioxygenase-like lactoylglutathione lyase family enzyme
MTRPSFVLAVLVGLLPTSAASHRAPSPLLETKGAFFALSVADVKASTAWYVEKLGLAVVMEVPASNGPAVTVLEGGGLIVELVHDAPATTGGADRMLVHGIVKAGVIVDDFDGTIAALRARRVEIAFGPFPRRPTARANVIVKDNAGNLIQIFGPKA